MNTQIEALILDDDIWSLRLVKGMLEQCFPSMKVQTRMQPDPTGEFDVYFIDNDFSGRRVLPELACKLRESRPDALIIAFSATLDASTLKALLNAGCDGACDKSIYGDLSRTMEIVRAYVEQKCLGGIRSEPQRGPKGAIQSIKELLREWNRRLEHEESRASSSTSGAAR